MARYQLDTMNDHDSAHYVRWNIVAPDGSVEAWVEARNGKVCFSGAVNGLTDGISIVAFGKALDLADKAAWGQRIVAQAVAGQTP